MRKKFPGKFACLLIIFLAVFAAAGLLDGVRAQVFAAEITAEMPPIVIPDVNFSIGSEGDGTASALQLMFLFVIIALIPTVLLMTTCFTRIIIMLHFMRAALATQQMPPNTVLIGIALVLTMFIMQEPLERIYNEAYLPFQAGQISAEEFTVNLLEPLRDYMFLNVDPDNIGLFGRLAGFEFDTSIAEYRDQVPMLVLIPAFMLSELRAGFEAGFWLFIPFIVIDMVVASTLMAMGMMMLPPAMISMPFKLMLFVLSDGWRRLVEVIAASLARF